MTKISGNISDVLFHNEKNGYTVAEVLTEGGAVVTLTGTLPYPGEGEDVEAEGEFVTHPSFGPQFKASVIERRFPTEAAAIYRYLASGSIKGIGLATARRIVDSFGADALQVIENDPERLSTLKGMTYKKAMEISLSFRQRTALASLNQFVTSSGLDPMLSMELYRRFGDQAVNVLLSNPYFLITAGLTNNFRAVDSLAMKNGFSPSCEGRVRSAVVYTLTESGQDGHCYLPEEQLVGRVTDMIGIDGGEALCHVAGMLGEELLVAEDTGEHKAIYLRSMYECEEYIAHRMLSFSSRSFPDRPDLRRIIESVAAAQRVEYAEAQREALEKAVRSGVMILTGGPGTGKTTTVRGLIGVFEAMGCSIALAAPTGRAAKRMSELCGREAKTIHRLLETTVDSRGVLAFSRNTENPLEAEVVIIDELSMVDIGLMRSLLEAVKYGARLVLVGDADQLPPVGPGSLLSDLLESEAVEKVCLHEIFRQAEESAIVRGAHAVNRGELPLLRAKEGDLFFLRRDNLQSLSETIVDLSINRLPNRLGINPADIQVLAPNRKGEGGVEQLNIMLQNALNPPGRGKKEKKNGLFTLREGDRVMQTSNNYDLPWRKNNGAESGTGVFNGDTGVILSISNEEQSVLIRFDEQTAVYSFDMLDQLDLAYATTVHKAQGSEYPVVILAVGLRHSRLLTRSLLYTAMTRAKKMLILVGREETVAEMAENNRRQTRYTGLCKRLKTLCGK